MPSISIPLVAAGVGAAGSIAGSVIGGNAATSAAKTQADAAKQAAQIQQQEFNTTTANEAPFLAAGNNSLAALMQGLGLSPGSTGNIANGSLNAPFDPSKLAQTPGYQWQLGQGEQAVTNAASATGGVGGGNTLKALTNYGQGLASTTYQQQLADYMAQQQQSFGQLQTVAGSGQNAAAQLGALGNQSATTIGNDLTSGAAATAAGQVGSANALTGGISGLSSNFLLASLLGGGGAGALGGLGGIGGSQTYNTTGIQTVG